MITDEWSVNLLGVETPGFTLRPGFVHVGLGARPLTRGERVVCASVSVICASMSVSSASVSVLHASVSPHVPMAASE